MWGSKVMLKTQDSDNTQLTETHEQFLQHEKNQKTLQDSFEKRIDLCQLVKIKIKNWGEKKYALVEKHSLQILRH